VQCGYGSWGTNFSILNTIRNSFVLIHNAYTNLFRSLPPQVMYTGNAEGNVPLGLDVTLQSFLLTHPLNAALGIAGSGPVRGAAATVAIQVTLDLSYSPVVAAGRRRRRRAAAAAGMMPHIPRVVLVQGAYSEASFGHSQE
jgi:hypothetical protein